MKFRALETRNAILCSFGLGLLLLTLSCNIQGIDINEPSDDVNNTDSRATANFSFKMAVTSQELFRLQGINGSIDVVGSSDADSVVIEGERRVESESVQDAEQHLQNLEVRTESSSGEIFVKTIQPKNSHGRNYVVDYTVIVPNNMKVTVGNVNGALCVFSVSNDVSVANVNGSIHLDDIIGNATVATVNGLLRNHVSLPIGGTLTMSTVNGNIELQIPNATSAEFSATVVNGSIRVSSLELSSPTQSPRSLSGTLADGQGRINLSTVNGNINVDAF